MVSKFLYQIEYIVDIHWVVCRNHVPSTRYLQDIRLLPIRICGLFMERNEYTTQNYNEYCTRDAGLSSFPLITFITSKICFTFTYSRSINSKSVRYLPRLI